VAAREVTAGQLWQIGLTISAVVLLNVAGIILRRVGPASRCTASGRHTGSG
jgi:hypothetical protein